jgi:hypothetical protein
MIDLLNLQQLRLPGDTICFLLGSVAYDLTAAKARFRNLIIEASKRCSGLRHYIA